MDDKIKSEIQKVYYEESECLPCKTTVDKTGQQNVILNKTIRELHQDFIHNGSRKVSLNAFRQLRPSNCLAIDKQKFAYCLCEYCINVEFNAKCLNDIARLNKEVTGTFEALTKYKARDYTVCPYDNKTFPNVLAENVKTVA